MTRNGEADVRFERTLRALGFAVLNLQKANEKAGRDGVRVTDIRFKLDADNRTSVLVILKGVREEEALVGFTGGPDLEVAVLSAAGKLSAGAVRWREDRPYGGV